MTQQYKFQFFVNQFYNSLTMEERGKKRYVEKQPPDKKPKYVAKNQESQHTQKQQKQQYHSEKRQDYKPRRKNESRVPNVIEKVSSSGHGFIDCLICSEPIKKHQPIWTCQCCYHYVHLKCIKDWIFNVNKDRKEKKQFILNWTCIQCKFEYNESMPEYYCFCGKFKNPQFQRDLQPHSCGKICQRKRGPYCPHLCPKLCHSGRCPPCEHQGTLITCNCGKTERITKCSQQRQIFMCGKKCEKILNCHKHKCQKNCHNGQCAPCKKKHMAQCYCGKNNDVVDCVEVSYSCEDPCDKVLDCGVHKCEDKCHQGDCNECQLKPSLQKTCPCGRNTLMLLTGDQNYRKSCKDVIPTCGFPCKKILACGHQCPKSCHEGKCPPCKISVVQNCDCGITSRKVQCYISTNAKQQFKCDNICKRKRTCGQHNCNVVCCKFRNSPIPENHQCELTCQKILNCKKHKCGEACHIGLCKKCPVIYSQAQACPCGRTSIKPPILCGTFIPECQNTCEKQMGCGHICELKCHYGPCRCFQKVSVKCRCGKEDIETTCGKQTLCLNYCSQFLQCGHKCGLQCHAGTCKDAHKNKPCRKNCQQKRLSCEHICNQPCHFGQDCDKFPCETEVLIKCQCGNRQTTIICGASQKQKGNKKSIICNKKCQNMKRFDALYKDKQIYYSNGLFQFGFKQFNYMEKLEARLEKFISHSQEPLLQIQFKFNNDHNAKLQLHNLFENHYHLNTHFYRVRNHASFTVMQTDDTMVPKPPLTDYIKQVSKGYIKRSNLPFEYTIKFEMISKDKADGVLSCLKNFKHKYYIERKDKQVIIHFWNKSDGLSALKVLEEQTIGHQFKAEQNIIQQPIQDQITQQQIIQGVIEEKPIKKKQKDQIQFKQQIKKQVSIEKQQTIQTEQLSAKQQSSPKQDIRENIKQQIKQPKIQRLKPKLIIRRQALNFLRSPYPPAKDSQQNIYYIDEDELFKQNVNWPKFITEFTQKNIGPQASQWKIRALLIINSFYKIEQSIIAKQFQKMVNLYDKQKQRAKRILEIQKIENKKIKQQMEGNFIYLSDNQPEIMSYLTIFNYWSHVKVQEPKQSQALLETIEMSKAYGYIESIQKLNLEEFYTIFTSSDYIMSCIAIQLVHQIRENILKALINKQKLPCKDLYKFLLFEDQQNFIKYCSLNGLLLQKKYSKTKQCEIYYLRDEDENKLPQKIIINCEFVNTIIKEKRNKKYFLNESEQLVQGKYLTRSYFAFGDFKQAVNSKYVMALARQLKS